MLKRERADRVRRQMRMEDGDERKERGKINEVGYTAKSLN